MNESTTQAIAVRVSVTFAIILVVLLVGYTTIGFLWGIALALVVSAVCGVLGAAKAIQGSFRDDPPASTGLRWSAAIYAGLAQLLIGSVVVGTLLRIASVLTLTEPFANNVVGGDFAEFQIPVSPFQLQGQTIAIALILIVVAIIATFFLAFSLATIGPTTLADIKIEVVPQQKP